MIKLGSHLKTYMVKVRSQVTVEAEIEVQATSAGQARIIAGNTYPEDLNKCIWRVVGGETVKIGKGSIERINVPETPVEIDG